MNRIRKLFILMLSCCFVGSCALLAAACTPKDDDGDRTEHTQHVDADNDGLCDECGEQLTPATPAGKITYTVTMQRTSGDPLPDVTVLPTDANGDIKAYGATDANGVVTFELEAGDYTLQFSRLPDGYSAPDTYTMSASNPNLTIKLAASVVKKTPTSSLTYALGSVMYDFEFIDSTGYTNTLSGLLEEKNAVLLNFWYTTCTWCIEEFPGLASAYGDYADKLAILAIDTNYETQATVEQFRTATGRFSNYSWGENGGLPFHMIGRDDNDVNAEALSLFQRFGFTGAPTSVIIDREGVVCFTAEGAGTEEDFREIFAKYTADDYEQDIMFPGEQTQPKPDVDPSPSEEIEAAINNTSTGFTASYYFIPEGQEAEHEYSWPWVVDTVDGEPCIRPTNSGINSSYSLIYTDIYVASDEQLIAFDVKSSCEQLTGLGGYGDALYVFIDGTIVTYYSGVSDEWVTCFAYFPLRAGTYTLSLAYMKDESSKSGDDAVYVRNMRFATPEEVDHLVEMPYHAADGEVQANQYTYYITPVFNEADGYYHVGTKDGPLLLADLMNATRWSNRDVWTGYILSGTLECDLDGDGIPEDCTNAMTEYCAVANNSEIYGLVTVTENLAAMLKALTAKYGEGGHQDTEWLEICMYYKRYGVPAGESLELPDPARGLAAYNAFEAAINTGSEDSPVETNTVNLNRILMPRGLWYRITAPEAGVYSVRTLGDYDTYGWLRDANGNILQEADDLDFRPDDIEGSDGNFCVRFFANAGDVFYICCALKALEDLGSYEFIVTRIMDEGDFWMPASNGFYTWEVLQDDEGNDLYDSNGELLLGDIVLDSAISYALGEDGYYYATLEDGSLGSRIYINLAGTTSMFQEQSISQFLNMDVTYCTVCGYAFAMPVSECYVCGARELASRKAFELPTPIRNEDGTVKVRTYTSGDLQWDVPQYERDDNGEIGFTDYTEIMREYAQRSVTRGNYPAARNEYDTDHYGFIDADETLVNILSMFILYGDHSLSPNISNAWLMLASYYVHLG